MLGFLKVIPWSLILRVLGWSSGLGAAAIGLWVTIKNDIYRSAQLDFNNRQLERLAHEREELDRKLDELSSRQSEILTELHRRDESVARGVEAIEEALRASKASPASPVLRETVRRLREMER